MTVIRLTKVEDLALAAHMVEEFHHNECIASIPHKREKALRPLLERQSLCCVYVVGSNEHVCGLCSFNIYFSVECGGVETVVHEVYLRHSLHRKEIGESVLERLFRTMASHGINTSALEVHQKNFNARRFYNSLGFRLRQFYNVMPLEMR